MLQLEPLTPPNVLHAKLSRHLFVFLRKNPASTPSKMAAYHHVPKERVDEMLWDLEKSGYIRSSRPEPDAEPTWTVV